MKYIKISFLLLSLALQFVLTACEEEHQQITLKLQPDYSGVVAAINDANRSLTEKMAMIEASVSSGLADNQAAIKLIQDAVSSLGGTMEQKIAAVEAAVKAQATSLETKLALVEAAVTNGFADTATQQDLLQAALESLGGTLEEKLSAIESAIKSQTTSLETKLGLVEAALKSGFADSAEAQALILDVIATLGETLEEQIASIVAAVEDGTTSLAAKLALIEAAVTNGFADGQAAQELIQAAIESLSGSVEEKMAALEAAVQSQTTSLETKMSMIEKAILSGASESDKKMDLIKQALESLSGDVDTKTAAIQSLISGQTTSLETKIGVIEAAVTNGFVDEVTALGLLEDAVEALGTSLGTVDSGLQTQIASVVASINTLTANVKTGDIATALSNILTAIQGLPDYSTVLATIQQAVDELAQLIENEKAFMLSYIGDPSYTVVKGQDIVVPLSVKPTSKVLDKDKLQISVVESKQFFPTNTGTVANHFSIKSLVADPSVEGQYNVTLTTDADEAVWDESTLAFVYDHGTDSKPDYFTTNSFQAVMMPRPVNGNKSCGVIPWKYPYASFCAVDSFFNAQGQLYPEDTLGVVYYALDKVTFLQKNGSETRTYTASNITSASFTPIDGNTAPVKCILDNEKHYVCFYPDTTNSKKWRDFQSSTGVKREDVAGILSLTDQWGVTSTYGVNMAWFNTYLLDVELTVSLQDQSLVKSGENAYYLYNLTDKFLEMGLDDDLMKDTRYGLLETAKPLTREDINDSYEKLDPKWKGSNREVDLVFNKPGNALAAGQKYRARGFMRLTVNPSDNTPNFTPTQVLLHYCISVNITN